LTQKAGDAAASAKTAHDEADAVRKETDELTARLASAAKLLGLLEQDVRVQGPRWRLLEDNRAALVDALKPFAGQRVTVVECGAWGKVETEPFKLAQETLDLLGDQGAGWSTSYASWVGYGTGGGSSSGGNLVTYRSTADKKVIDAADALTGAFNKVEISTIEIQTIQGGRQQGADSPWELAKKDPTAAILLIGDNPMFDVAGWKDWTWPALDLHQARAAFGSPGHSCTLNFPRRYSSAPTASRACVAGVKNLRWHLVHDAIAGTLPMYLTMMKLRSAMAGTLSHGSVGVPMARSGYGTESEPTRSAAFYRRAARPCFLSVRGCIPPSRAASRSPALGSPSLLGRSPSARP